MQYTISKEGKIAAAEYVEPHIPFTQWPEVQPLPPEILIKIFEHFNEDTQWRPHEAFICHRRDFKFSLLPLMLACQRFRKLIEPILYQRTFITFNTPEGQRSRKRLLDTLRARSDLFQYIQHLHISFFGGSDHTIGLRWEERGDNEEEDIEAAVSFLHKVTPKKIILDGEWESTIDPRLCLALARLELEELHLQDSWGQFWFQYFRSGRSSLLKRLRLSGCYSYWFKRDRSGELQELPTMSQAVNQDFLVRIETLKAYGGDMHADFLYDICQFISTLKKFRLQGVMHYRHSQSYCRSSLRKILDLHKDTLEVIELPIFFGPDDRIPNLTEFPSLRRLFISWDNLAIDTPSVAMQKLTTPLLEYLAIDMDHGDQQINLIGSFGEDEAKWLADFAGCRVSESHLEYFHIIFAWDSDTYSLPVFENDNRPWPNSHLQSLKPVLEIKGVTLSWNKPYFSEEQWMEAIDNQGQYYGEPESSEPSKMDSEVEDEIDVLCMLPREVPGVGSSQKCIDHYYTAQMAK